MNRRRTKNTHFVSNYLCLCAIFAVLLQRRLKGKTDAHYEEVLVLKATLSDTTDKK